MNIVPPAELPPQMTSCATALSEGPRSPGCASAYPWQLLEAEYYSWQGQLALSSIDDNFLTQVVGEPTGRDELLDLVLTNKEGLVGDVKVGGSSEDEMVEL
ncbi:mast stem cell growth factor receptor kit [Limosa lapponica baueri]|uniref:Mast stem cell growth factor receptor kit n=1 Tax=Limosa lapponica baueri TaxID=1758121 RepID=A0A2I0U8V2_LIMLA|nr:mast stem cell growth factor receptor kit [Limosa lapponica baueri]